MTRIPFIHARFFDTDTTFDIEERLKAFLRTWRQRSFAEGFGVENSGGLTLDAFGEELMRGVELSSIDRATIKRRAERIIAARAAVSGLAHLKKEEVKTLSWLRSGVDLVIADGLDWADLVAATLHDEFPWMAPATTEVWMALRRAAVGGQVITIPNLLLCGPPGIGKSAWARRMAALLTLPSCVIEIGSGSTSFRIAGLERGWAGGMPGRPLETIIASRIGNPVVIVDEICKDQGVRSTKGGVNSASDSLLALMEPMTAEAWECPFYRIRFDMRHVNWVLTANVLEGVSEPLRSRSTVVVLSEVPKGDLCRFARRYGAAKGLTEESIEAIVMALDHPANSRRDFSVRDVVRMVERAVGLESRGYGLH